MTPLTLRLEVYSKLSSEDKGVLDRLIRGTPREIGARRDLIREGDKPRAPFVLLEGWACRYKTLPDGRRQIVDFLLPGDFCDLKLHLLMKMDHAIGAITALQVADIHPEELEQVTARHPRIAHAIWMDEMAKISVQREWTLNIGQRTAYERIAHILCETYLRLEAVGQAKDGQCEFPLTQLDLADATGLTAVHVNRTLQELRRDALIELHSRTLIVSDLEALKSAGLFNGDYLHFYRTTGDSHAPA